MRGVSIAHGLLFLVVGCDGGPFRDCGARPEHEASEYAVSRSEEIVEVEHQALRVRRSGPECDDADVKYTAPGGVAPLVFHDFDGRCSMRFIRAADVSRVVPSQEEPARYEDHRIAIAFTSAEAMNAWMPFAGCRPIATRELVDDWAVALLGPALKPRDEEPDRAMHCPRAHTEDIERFLLYYDESLLVVAATTMYGVDRFTRPPHHTPTWAR
jgi:hypothetical protein